MAQAQPRGFMKMEGATIQGDSKAKNFEGQIIVLDLSFGVTQSGTYEKDTKHIKTYLSEVSVRKYVGASSAELLQACAKKTPFTKVQLVILGRLQATLERVIVTGISTAVQGEDEHPTEVITLSYEKVEWLSWTDKDKGTGSFDIILNELE
jgi:type VI protein secretion system component Hcp